MPQRLATLIQLEQEARQAPTREALSFIMVNRTARLLPYTIALFWTRQPAGPRLAAVSGVPALDRNTPFVDAMEQLLANLDRPAQPPVATIDPGLIEAPELRSEWEEYLPPQVLACRIGPPAGEPLGGLWLARDEPWSEAEMALVETLAGAYGHALAALERSPRRHFLPGRNRRLAAAAIACAALAIPVPQSVLAPATVVDRDPLVVAAPLDGVIEAVEVEPNQRVAAGEPLFRLEDTSARSRLELAVKALAVAEAELLKARQEAFSDPGQKARLALLEAHLAQRIAERDHAAALLARTRVRAERGGFVLFTDPNDWLGRPVATGERVMTITDPERAELEIRLPVADAIPLTDGAPVTAWFNADPLRPVEARLRRIGYEAYEAPDGLFAYRLKAAFIGEGVPPRIGLQATAKVRGERVTLFWYLLRRPVTALRQGVGF